MKSLERKKLRTTTRFVKKIYKPHKYAKIPANFNIDYVNRFLHSEANIKFAEEAYWFILNRIISKNDKQGYDLISKYCKPVPISHVILKEIFGNSYIHYLKALEDSRVIKKHSSGRKGISSSTYFLREDYRYEEIITKEHSARIVNRIKKSFDRHLPENKIDFNRYSHLIHWFTTSKLTIDKEGGLKCIQEIEQVFHQKLIEKGDQRKLDDFNKAAKKRKQKLNNVISRIEKNRHYIKIDRNHRLHTVFSSMPEPLRHFLKYDGEELVATDVANSQPFHFCYLFEKDFWAGRSGCCSLKSIHPGLYDDFKKSGQLTLIRKLIRHSKKQKDVTEFLRLAKSGEIYEELSKRYGSKYSSLNTRDKAKREFVTFLNFDLDNKDAAKYGAYRRFAIDYPGIAELMELIKGPHYKDMSTILQMFEAKMFLVKCGREYSSQFPDVPLFSIHDTFITLKSYQKELEDVIKDTYKEHFDFQPVLKSTSLNPEGAFTNIQKYVGKKFAKLFPNG